MAGLAGLKDLRRLMLRDTLVTDEGLQYLKDLPNLEELDLSGTRVTDKGIEYLRNLKSLRRLNLLSSTASDAAMDVLAGLPHLEVLNLYRTKITNSGVAKLQALKELKDVQGVRYTLVTPNRRRGFAQRATRRTNSVRQFECSEDRQLSRRAPRSPQRRQTKALPPG